METLENEAVNTEQPKLLRDSGPVTCPDCNRQFKNAHALSVHRGQAHGPDGPRTWSRYKGGSVKKKDKDVANRPKFHYRNEPTKCPDCGEQFSTGRGAAVHWRQAHSGQEDWRVKRRGPYKKRNQPEELVGGPALPVATAAPGASQPTPRIHYCPQCGQNLDMFTMAIDLMAKMDTV